MIEKIISRLEAEINEFMKDVPDGDYLRGNVNFCAIAKGIVQEVVKEGSWVLCSERLPEEHKLVLIYAESTARGGSIRRVAQLHNGFWFVQTASDTLGLIGQYNVIKWAELPEV